MKDQEYQDFYQYMKETRSFFHQQLFSQDIMYFCKIWKSHRQAFAQYCKKQDCVRTYILLSQRCVDYETSLLDHKYLHQQISEQDYHHMQRQIEKVFI